MHPALFAICRLIGLAALGFVIFKIPAMAHKPKRVFRFIVIDMLIPIYFASNFPRGWRALLGYGWHVVVIIIAGGRRTPCYPRRSQRRGIQGSCT